MTYQATNFEHLLGTEGFSDQLLKNHFTLYQGYVTNTNKLVDILAGLANEGKTATPEFAEQTRRLGWEFDGMRLHEYYFANMKKGGSSLDKAPTAQARIKESFGSYEAWEKWLKGVGAMRGIGWAVLYHDVIGEKLCNTWINEHDTGHLAGCTPILVMDVFEHAYMTDYGLKRADYITAFFKAIDWEAVEKRISAVR
jgi:superoxide dismutase, Fe-Mn family